jgi:hypothetical protein
MNLSGRIGLMLQAGGVSPQIFGRRVTQRQEMLRSCQLIAAPLDFLTPLSN